jgi:lysozyme
VLRLIAVPLTAGQFDALVSFTFNLGGGALQRSTLRRKVNREEHAAVPAELMEWVWAGGRKLKGLVRRREAEAALYLA